MISLAIALWAIVGIGILLALYGHFIEPRRLRLTCKAITIPNLREELEGLTIVHLSDFHCSPHSTNLSVAQQAVQLAVECDPDLIVVTGDLAHGSGNLECGLELLRSLHARYGVFVVLGNHDIDWTLDNLIAHPDVVHHGWERWVQAVEGLDATLLENDHRVVWINGRRVGIVGLGDACSQRQDFNLALNGIGDVDLRLLLNHSPDILDAPQSDWADLTLCGHTHGGQWQLPGLGTLWAPVWRDFRRSAGLLRCGDTQCYVSRGVGSAVQIRINCPPEVVLITLKRGPARGRPCRRYGEPEVPAA